MRQADTWCWPSVLDKMTSGICSQCQEPIYFELKNRDFVKICHVCAHREKHMIDKRDEMFEIMIQMSDRQVDPQVKTRLKTFIGKPNEEVKDQLIDLINDVVHYALTSDFEIKVMDIIWKEIGGTQEDLEKSHERKRIEYGHKNN